MIACDVLHLHTPFGKPACDQPGPIAVRCADVTCPDCRATSAFTLAVISEAFEGMAAVIARTIEPVACTLQQAAACDRVRADFSQTCQDRGQARALRGPGC